MARPEIPGVTLEFIGRAKMITRRPQEGLFHPATLIGAEETERAARPTGVRRRTLLRWLGWGSLLALLAQWFAGFLNFFWPRKAGSFGAVVMAGSVEDIQKMPVGTIRTVREGKFYLSRVPEGVVALWWKCPHLGCTVPWRETDPSEDTLAEKGRFNCPCHGSIYDRYGQIIAGPAPRPMDIFPIEIRDGKVLVATGPSKAVQRPKVDRSQHVTPI